jgi:integrase
MGKTKRFLFAPPREDVDAMERQTQSLEERVIFRLEPYAGLRSCEIVGDGTHPGLRAEDVDFQREKLMIYGKGWATGKVPPKEQPCDKNTLELLKQLMVEKKISKGKLFPSWYTRKHRRFIKALAIRAGVPHAQDMGTHRLRAHFVTHIIRKTNGNLILARDLARHKDVRTTGKYVFLMTEETDKAYHEVMD